MNQEAGHVVLETCSSGSLGDIPAEFSDWLHCSDLFVLNQYRKKRFGSLLIDRAVDFASRVQTKILCEVDPYAGISNENLTNALTRHGFSRLDGRFLYFDPKNNSGGEK